MSDKNMLRKLVRMKKWSRTPVDEKLSNNGELNKSAKDWKAWMEMAKSCPLLMSSQPLRYIIEQRSSPRTTIFLQMK